MSKYLSIKKQKQFKKKSQRGKSIEHISSKNGTLQKVINPETNGEKS